ncbi:hypothetical protein [Bacillus cytotoxicus]|uniref:hypothetical protein n=1 Tax=Bacillus cytotoxicus TaxID=580165 RepID=UPI003D7E4B5D
MSEVLRGYKRESQLFHTVFSYQESKGFEGIVEEKNISQLGAEFELTGNIKKFGDRVFCELEFSDETWTPEERIYFADIFSTGCFSLFNKT